MRHIITITAFTVVFLVPSLALAESDHKDHGDNAHRERRMMMSGFKQLNESDRTKFKEITNTSLGEYMLPIDQRQLVSFMKYIGSNPAASCSVKSAPSGMRPNHNQDYSPRPALVCNSGPETRKFVGVPARVLNQYYDTNIQLSDEAAATPSAPAPTTPDSSNVAVTTASTQLDFNAYLAQSASDINVKPSENTAFVEKSAKPQSVESNMHFSDGASETASTEATK